MNRNIYIFFTFLVSSFSVIALECSPSFQCLNSTITYDDNFCRYENEKEIKYFRPCSSGYTCTLNINRDPTRKIVACEKKYQRKAEGSACLLPEECETDVCKDKKCTTKITGEECASDNNCAKDSMCKNNFCKVSVKEDGECDSTEDCYAGYYCGKKDQNATNRICILQYSILNGQYASDETLCESGKLDSRTNLCYDTESKVAEGTSCSTDLDCKGTKIMGETTTEVNLVCDCTWNQKLICAFGTRSERWKNFVSYYKKIIPEKKLSYRKGAGIFRELPSNDRDVNSYYLKTVPFYYNAPSCILDYVNSYSQMIKLSLVFLSGLCVLLL